MDTQKVLITGSTDGIGKQTAKILIEMGYSVIIHGKDENRCKDTVIELSKLTGKKTTDYLVSDFSSMKNVNQMVRELSTLDRLDILINNAGIFSKERIITEEGFELTFAVNHLSHFLLTNQLLNLMRKSPNFRIIHLSSIAHRNGKFNIDNLDGSLSYSGYSAYSISKMCNILFSNELSKRLSGTGGTSNSLHPGVITTKLLKAGFGITGDSLEEGAKTSVYLATSPNIVNVTGKYFINCKEEKPAPAAYSTENADLLWKYSVDKLNSIGIQFNS